MSTFFSGCGDKDGMAGVDQANGAANSARKVSLPLGCPPPPPASNNQGDKPIRKPLSLEAQRRIEENKRKALARLREKQVSGASSILASSNKPGTHTHPSHGRNPPSKIQNSTRAKDRHAEIRHEGPTVWPEPGQLGTKTGNKLEWACPTCTFLNPLSKSHCGACGSVNPSHKNQWQIGYKSYGAYTKAPAGEKKHAGGAVLAQAKLDTKRRKLANSEEVGGMSNMKPYRPAPTQPHGKQTMYTGDFLSAKSPPGKSFRAAREAPSLRGGPVLRINDDTKNSWIYPTNYPVRDYQRSIVESALFQNTLVCLPTGLGKTLIAAVVMYNYYRWFPEGKIIFMAPTKPLVEQQVKACHQIMSIPLSVTARLDGSIKVPERKKLWKSQNLFFCTPQTFRNDCSNGMVDIDQVTLLVFDEAHRATGNYAYTLAIQLVQEANQHFRVLALSATPGSTRDSVQEVMDNLLISHIEVRGDDDPDVRKYTHAKMIEFIEVKKEKTGVMERLRLEWVELMRPMVQRLSARNILFSGDAEKATKSSVYFAYDRFKENVSKGAVPGMSLQECRSFMGQCMVMISLAHAHDLLKNHGLESFVKALDSMDESANNTRGGSSTKRDIINGVRFKAIHVKAKKLVQGKTVQHPKVTALIDLLRDHFNRANNCGKPTKAIVFTEFRSSVDNILGELETLAPLVKVQGFVGQSNGSSSDKKEKKLSTSEQKRGAAKPDKNSEPPVSEESTSIRAKGKGMTQKDQQRVMKEFREGVWNVLICTCIGEEGLDIGEVDLIIAFDAVGSPTRMTQRFGRTGRKRAGRVVVLMTPEDKKKQIAATQKSKKIKHLLVKGHSTFMFYNRNPLMLPEDCDPVCVEQEMSISDFHSSQVGGSKMKKKRKSKVDDEPYDITVSQKQRCENSWGLSLNHSQHLLMKQRTNSKSLKLPKAYQQVYAIGHSESSSIAMEMLNFEEKYASLYRSLCQASVSSLENSGIVEQSRASDAVTDTKRTVARAEWNWMDDSNEIKEKEQAMSDRPTILGIGACILEYVNQRDPDDISYDETIAHVFKKLVRKTGIKYDCFCDLYRQEIEKEIDACVDRLRDVEKTMFVEQDEELDRTLVVAEEEGLEQTMAVEEEDDELDQTIVVNEDKLLDDDDIFDVASRGKKFPSDQDVLNALEEIIFDLHTHNPLSNMTGKQLRQEVEKKLNLPKKGLKHKRDFIKVKGVEIFLRLKAGKDNKNHCADVRATPGDSSKLPAFKTPRHERRTKYEYGQEVQVKDSGRWWDATIERVKVEEDGLYLYNISGDEPHNGAEWSISDVSEENIRVRSSGNGPKLFVAPISEIKIDPKSSSRMYLESPTDLNFSGDPFASQNERIEVAIKEYLDQPGPKRDIQEVQKLFRSASAVLEHRDLVPSPPRFSWLESPGAEAAHSKKVQSFKTPEAQVQGEVLCSHSKRVKSSNENVTDALDHPYQDTLVASDASETGTPSPNARKTPTHVPVFVVSDSSDEEISPIVIKRNQRRIIETQDDEDVSLAAPKKRSHARKVVDTQDDDDDDSSFASRTKVEGSAQENTGWCPFESNEEDDSPCSICLGRDSFDMNPILYCDGCNLAFHQQCYGVKHVPPDDFYCEICQHFETRKNSFKTSPERLKRNACHLCPTGWLPLQKSVSGKWVHPQCVMFTNETFFENDRPNIRSLDPARRNLICKICGIERGACIQCMAPGCFESFHVTCAQATSLARMITVDGEDLKPLAFCAEHLSSFNKKAACGEDSANGASRKRKGGKRHIHRGRSRRVLRDYHNFIELEPEMVGRMKDHKDDMECDGSENDNYDMNDSFLHDATQSSGTGNTPRGYLAFRDAFSQESPGLNFLHKGRTKRTAMPIIDQCLHEITGKGGEPLDDTIEPTPPPLEYSQLEYEEEEEECY